MKKLLLMLAIPAFFAFTVSAGNVKIKTRIANPHGQVINVKVGDKTYELKMDAAGVGSVDVDVKGETFATFSYPNIMDLSIYLTEGKDLEVSFDIKKRGADLAITCDDKGINEYLLAEMRNKKVSRADFKLDEAEFLAKFDNDIKTKKEEIYSKSFSKKFKKAQLANVTYDAAGAFSAYPSYHAYFAKLKDFEPSDKFYNKLSSLAKENTDLVSIKSYIDFMSGAVKTLACRGQKVNSNLQANVLAAKEASKLKINSLKENLVFQYTHGYIQNSGIDGTEELMKIFKANVKDDAKIGAIDALVTKWSKVAKGQPSPKFNLKDINGKMVSLDDLKGKYVYVDCWATWCGPCCGEIPSLKTLEHDYHGKNIHFVSISCDKNEAAWKAKVEKEQLGGYQLILGKDRSFMDEYMVRGIPRFILIDKKGNIYNANAPRPSNPEVRTLFDSLKGL